MFDVVRPITDPDKPVITITLLKDKLKIWWDKMVKSLKESASSSWAAPILLALLLGYNIYSGQQADKRAEALVLEQQKQSVLIAEIKKEKEVTDRFVERDRHELIVQLGEAETWRKVLENRLNKIEFQKGAR